MNEPTVSPCWLPVGENHAGARGESRCSTAAKDGSLAPSVRRHPCLELQWGGWATKICPETPPLELLAAVRAERQGFSWNGCRCQGTRGGGLAQLDLQVGTYLRYLEMPGSHCNSHSARGGDLDAGHCPPCCSEALADNRMPPAPLGQVCLAVGWQLLQVPVGARFSPPPRARIYYSTSARAPRHHRRGRHPPPLCPRSLLTRWRRAVTLFGSSFHRRNLRCRTSRSPKSRWENPAQMGS